MDPKKLVSHDLADIRIAGLCALKLSVTSWPPLAAQCSRSNVFLSYHIQPRTWIVWLVWWPMGSRCVNGSSSSPSQRTFHFSSRERSGVKCRILSKLTVGPCSATTGNSIAARYKETRSPALMADGHKIRVLVMLGNKGLPTPSDFSMQYSLPLCDVGRNSQGIQTTHTVRAQPH